MKKLNQADKVWHFVAGAAVMVATAYIMGGGAVGIKTGMFACAAIAAAKEFYDASAEGHGANGVDFVATVAGGTFAAVMML